MYSPCEDTAPAVQEILTHYPATRGSLIPVLQAVQHRFGYLSEDALAELEQGLGISANEIYGVATFYTQFRFHPPGDHVVHVCQGTACHVRGGAQNMAEFQQRLGIKAGEITPDNKFELGRVACLGCCALAPVVSVDGKAYARVTPKKISTILSEYQK
jgi:NADH-quinone oxidoreductase subunit E